MLSKGNVLIHCETGYLYALVLAISFLMKKFCLVYSEVKEVVLKNCQNHFIPRRIDRDFKNFERLIVAT